MLEKIAKRIGSRFMAVALAASLMPSTGCAIYNTILPGEIQPVKPAEKLPDEVIYKLVLPGEIQPIKPIEKSKNTKTKKAKSKRIIDYSKLTWQEAIVQVQTPEQAQDYLYRHLKYWEDHHYDSFKTNHNDRRGVCLDYAIAAAALLSDNNYPPLILHMNSKKKVGHAVFLYNLDGKYFALGTTPMTKGYDSINELIKAFPRVYDKEFHNYFILDFNKNYGTEWIDSDAPIQIKRVWMFDTIPVK